MWSKIRRWWCVKSAQYDIPWQHDGQFWGYSLLLHLALLGVLAKLLFSPDSPVHLNIVSDAASEMEIIELPPAVSFDEMKFDDVGDDSSELSAMADSAVTIFEEIELAPVELDIPSLTIGDLAIDEEFENTTAENITSIQTKGAVGVATTGASGAVDRITEEILLSLNERKTMVVWLFDESASLISQRDEIRSRIDKIYLELNVLAGNERSEFTKHGSQPLLSTVYAFGGNFHRMLPDPTDNTEAILDAISNIRRDESGLEYVFSAVIQAATDFKKMRKLNRLTNDRDRNVMIIVVSDEAGDDVMRLDEAVKMCTNLQIPVHVIGIPAPFGRQETQVRWVDPDPEYDQTPQWAIVSQGPESMMPEMVKLDFNDGEFDNLEMIDSGFGPFGLTRLCYETGGIYFAVHPNRKVGAVVRQSETAAYSAYLRNFFEPEVMRRYKPDYVTQSTYMQRLTASKTRMSLVQAAQLSQVGAFQTPIVRFPKLDEAQFVNLASLAQRGAAILEPKLNQLYEVLKVGEADRDLEMSPRWQAGYDLAYGRVLANKVRVEAYNAMLAMIKTKLTFKNERNNTWVLNKADVIETGSQAEAMANKAKMYLKRVVNDHPGTPWAMLAQRELDSPIGWQWIEDYTEPPRPPEMRDNNNNVPNIPNVPQPQENAMPKPKRPPPRL